jgi:putative membrane protein
MSTIDFLASAWDWKPTVVIGCLVLIAGYVRIVRGRLTRRSTFWFAGVLLIAIALLSPVNALADRYLFSVHMAKHIAFVLIAPALLMMGTPRAALQPLLLNRAVARLEQVLRTPAIAWTAGIGVMAFWHIPAVFNAALAHQGLHIVEHLSLLIGGTIYWWPVLSPFPEFRLRPVPDAAAYLFTSCLACTSIGVLITFAPTGLYPAYTNPQDLYGMLPTIRERWGISPAMDQQIGGLLMWVPGCLVYLTAIMGMFARWYGEEAVTTVEA